MAANNEYTQPSYTTQPQLTMLELAILPNYADSTGWLCRSPTPGTLRNYAQ
jgi:hypothetical protein